MPMERKSWVVTAVSVTAFSFDQGASDEGGCGRCDGSDRKAAQSLRRWAGGHLAWQPAGSLSAAGGQGLRGRHGQRRNRSINESARRGVMTDDTYSRRALPGVVRVGANGGAAPALDPRRWAALVVILVAGVMDLLDVTIVNVAAPSILRDLDATYAQFEWVVSGYVLGFAALLITGGRLNDCLVYTSPSPRD